MTMPRDLRCLPVSFSLLVCLVLVLLATGAAGQALSVDTDFGKADQQVSYDKPLKGKIGGVLPTGWSDDSSWADVDVQYSVTETEGRRHLRWHVSRVKEGQSQMRADLPTPDGSVQCALTITYRNHRSDPMKIGIRQRGAPYAWLWESPPLASAEWTTRTFRFVLPKRDHPIGLYMIAPGTGDVDIAQVKLGALDRKAYEQSIRKAYPDHGPANVFRDVRIAGALPAGWSLDRNTSDGDEADVDVSGWGTLDIHASKAMQLYTAPFAIVDPLVGSRAVVRVEGTGRWRLEVINKDKVITGVPIQWREDGQATDAIVNFRPDLFDPKCQLVFKAEEAGTLKLHWVKVGPASKVDGFDAGKLPAVGIALPQGDAHQASVQFNDEQAVVNIHVLDAPAKSRLAVLIHHGRSEVKRYLERAPGDRVAIEYDLGDAQRYGAFRITAWLIDRNRKAISPKVERIVYRLRRPRYWGEDGVASAFGVHTNSTTRHNIMAKAIGMNWVRLHDAGLEYIGWWNLEKHKGKWTFHDKPLERYRKHNLKIFAELGTAPAWASYYNTSGKKGFGYWDKFFQPRDLKDYENYVRKVTTRYRDVIDAWDVWNEPWIHAWWAVDYDTQIGGRAGYIPSEHPQRDFVALKKVAYQTVKSIQPKATVAGFNTTANSSPSKTRFTGSVWTRGVDEAGGMAYGDVIAYHQYTGGSVGHPQDSVAQGLVEAVGPLREKYRTLTKPIWMTEGQPNIGRSGDGMYIQTVLEDAADNFSGAGDRMARYLVSLRVHGVARFFLYSMHSHNGIHTPKTAQWRVITQFDGTLHPVGAAISTCAYHIDGLAHTGHVEIAKGVHVYIFADDARTVAVVSPQPNHAAWNIPQGAQDIWGNPILAGTPLGHEMVYLTGEAAKRLSARAKL